jgi:cytochrome P450
MYIPQLPLLASKSGKISAIKMARSPETQWPQCILQDDIVVYEKGEQQIVLIADPNELKKIFGAEESKFPKWLPIYKLSAVKETGPRSIFGLNDQEWLPIRSAIYPLFAKDRLDLLIRNSEVATQRVLTNLVRNQGFEILVSQIAVEIIWKTLLGDGPTAQPPECLNKVAENLIAAHSIGDLKLAMQSITLLADYAQMRQPGDFALKNIDFAGECPMRSQSLNKEEREDNRLALLYSGQETTVLTLCWAIWLIGQDDKMQSTLREEAKSVVSYAPLNSESCKKLNLLSSFIKETLRLFSPSVSTVRTNIEDVTLSGEKIKKGAIIVVPIYAIHRHKKYWKEPESFRLERFKTDDYPAMAYMPFIAGRHTCIAARSSIFELQTILATLLVNLSWKTFDAHKMELKTHLVLSPSKSMNIEFKCL